jgi:hypothetical protein
MKLWKYIEEHHDDLGCLWFIVPMLAGLVFVSAVMALIGP